ncbi:hypothetical protein SynA1528_00149 [Synechococcus sp. A15-28]|nr:hypothetical protein SynA1528_00149 [Synechococcus sp. A15-28]
MLFAWIVPLFRFKFCLEPFAKARVDNRLNYFSLCLILFFDADRSRSLFLDVDVGLPDQ